MQSNESEWVTAAAPQAKGLRRSRLERALQRPSEHGLSAEEAVAHAQAEGLVLVRSGEGEGNSGFAGVEHVSRAVELQDCPKP